MEIDKNRVAPFRVGEKFRAYWKGQIIEIVVTAATPYKPKDSK